MFRYVLNRPTVASDPAGLEGANPVATEMWEALESSGGCSLRPPKQYYGFLGASGGYGLGDLFGATTGFGQPSSQTEGYVTETPPGNTYISWVRVTGGPVCNTIDAQSHWSTNAGAVRLFLRDWPKGAYLVTVEVHVVGHSTASSGGGSFKIKDAKGKELLGGTCGVGRSLGLHMGWTIPVTVSREHGDALVLQYEPVLAQSAGATGQSQLYVRITVHRVRLLAP